MTRRMEPPPTPSPFRSLGPAVAVLVLASYLIPNPLHAATMLVIAGIFGVALSVLLVRR